MQVQNLLLCTGKKHQLMLGSHRDSEVQNRARLQLVNKLESKGKKENQLEPAVLFQQRVYKPTKPQSCAKNS